MYSRCLRGLPALILLIMLLLTGCGRVGLGVSPGPPTTPPLNWPLGWHPLAHFSNTVPKIGLGADVTPTTTWKVLGSCSGKGALTVKQDGVPLLKRQCPQPQSFSTSDQPPPQKQIEIRVVADDGVFYEFVILEKNPAAIILTPAVMACCVPARGHPAICGAGPRAPAR